MHLWQWLGRRDRDFAALRRAGRTAIVMPGVFALGVEVIGSPNLATFAAFGAFAMLLLVDFGGPMTARLQAQAALVVAGGVLYVSRYSSYETPYRPTTLFAFDAASCATGTCQMLWTSDVLGDAPIAVSDGRLLASTWP